MAWQNTFTALFGPGLFGGITFGDWFRLLRDNGFRVHPRYTLRCLSICGSSLANSAYHRLETWRYAARFRSEHVPPPLFVLGHWRSGTTHLHNLLSRDERFAAPTLYQTLYPHTFLVTEAVNTRLMSIFMPQTRFGMDNVRMGWDVPYEDEFAIAAMTSLSLYVSLVFPHRHEHYDRYLTFRGVAHDEIDRWKAALMTFLKKLIWKHRRPLVLKSPGHTCRIRSLLEMFPDAKFVHIRRNPLHVFQSMHKMLSVAGSFWRLQRTDSVDWEARLIRQYREMYDVYFQQKQLIPDGQLHELSYEDLEADPIGQLRTAYETLGLPEFGTFEPRLQEYVDSLRSYRKNVFPELAPETHDRLAREWQACIDAWGYSPRPRI